MQELLLLILVLTLLLLPEILTLQLSLNKVQLEEVVVELLVM
jgi:hypothetical protein